MSENHLALMAALAGVATVHLGENTAEQRTFARDSREGAVAAEAEALDADATSLDVWRKILFSTAPTIS